ncbi:transglutaminase N-terminal domain-containing protein, partial [Hansschlegelia beijingensis]
MIYDLSLNIAYDYPAAVKEARHVLRVRPRELEGQSVRSMISRPGSPSWTSRALSAAPPRERASATS